MVFICTNFRRSSNHLPLVHKRRLYKGQVEKKILMTKLDFEPMSFAFETGDFASPPSPHTTSELPKQSKATITGNKTQQKFNKLTKYLIGNAYFKKETKINLQKQGYRIL